MDRLAHVTSQADIRWVASHPTCTEGARFPVAGSADVSWLTSNATVVAHGVETATGAGGVKQVTMHITQAGKALLSKSNELTLTLSETLTPSGGGSATTATVPLTLSRGPAGVTGHVNGCIQSV
jgi:hypothetical protein